MRVGWVASDQTIESFGRILAPLAVGLMDELVEIVAICPLGAEIGELPSPPVELIPSGKSRRGLLRRRGTETLTRQIRSRKVHLIHALDAESASLARRLAHDTKTNYILTCHALGDARRLGLMHRRAGAVLGTSEPVITDLIKHHAAPAEKVRLLRPGVHQVHQASCFLDPERTVTIVAGTMGRGGRGLREVIKAFAKLHQQDYDCRFFVISDRRGEKRLRALVKRLDLRHEVTFVDRKPASCLPGIFKAADIYVSAAPTRGLDVHSLLAMAAGVPVLGAKKGVGDFLLDGTTVLQFPAGETSQIVTKLGSLLDDTAWAKGLAERALEYLRKNHTPAQMVTALVEIYRDVIGEKPAPKSVQ
ncbi:MAG: glycosyltransferase family 4 protein [Phycisphaerae bacterium]|nr:glycosyltransferase family 4 protein [Phycisphaerae bacterium]